MDFKEIEQKIKEIVPEGCEITKIEPEGLDIVIYVKKIKTFYDSEYLIKRLSGAIRKRIVVRLEDNLLMEPEKAKKKILELVPKEAEVEKVRFDPVFSEVWIESVKPGLVIGKKGLTLRSIIETTGWAPKILRVPTMKSETIEGIRNSLFQETKKRKKFLNKLGKDICKTVEKSEWVKATALGGFREVGRSSVLIQTQNSNILIDCGINPVVFEGQKAFPYLKSMNLEPSDLDAVILSHTHLDHTGFVPYLYAYGYQGPIYCTEPTRDMMIMLQRDYLNIVNKYAGTTAPYAVKDIHEELLHTVTIGYNEVVDITPDIKLTFYNAGHVLGSSMIHLHIDNGLHNLVYTGDFKFGFTRLCNNANNLFPRVETLFMESTYGGKNNVLPDRRETDEQLVSLIEETINNGGKVLIPAFAVGRSQEVMLVLEDAFQNGRLKVPVYLDGMILEASAIHTAYPEYLRNTLKRKVLSNQSPFECEIFEIPSDRQAVIDGGPCVIISTSGMVAGGPVMEYLRNLADDPKNLMVFIGYQSPLSLGSRIQRGEKDIPLVNKEGKSEMIKMNMRVETVEGYSGHSGRKQLMAFVHNISPKPEKIFVMHGDEKRCLDLVQSIKNTLKVETRAPMNMDTIRLR
ncbi:MAG: beta-CASP ribonuclease aCPSF1 [Candidatus Micrarchaeia archaeon]